MRADAGTAAGIAPERGPAAQERFITRPGANSWRIETARRAACLIDGAAYFAAARACLLKARHSVLLVGWNFSDRMRLVPDADGAGWPDELGPFLDALADRRDLAINVLAWNMAPVLALGRREWPGAQAARMKRRKVRYHLDAAHPALATHHQKLLVVDDAVAFCGGFDFAANRWDSRAHLPGDPRRRLPNGLPYDAHHDVMLAVDGDAARALGDLARDRWRMATGERLDPAPPGLAWPDDRVPQFRDVPVAVVRTAPAWADRPPVREAEALFLDAIAAARDSIYIESQYFAAPRIADALAARLRDRDGPEIVVINPRRAPSATEQVAMDTARTRMLRMIKEADRFGRFRLYAALNGSEEIVVHSKVMIVDDALLRVGSANLNNRSLGVDTECDLAIEAARAPDPAEVRQTIAALRADLLAEHLGADPEALLRLVAGTGSMLAAIDALNGRDRRRLAPFPEPRPNRLVPIEHNALFDPVKPIGTGWRAGRVRLALGVAAGLTLAAWAVSGHRRRTAAGRAGSAGGAAGPRSHR